MTRPVSIAATAVLAVLVLAGCSGDGSDDASAAQPSATPVAAGCEDSVDQEPAIAFDPDSATHEKVDALMGLNFNAAGAPCVDVFVWDAPQGWTFDHYSITSDFGVEGLTTLTSTDDDFINALRFTPIMGCAPVHSELVYTKGEAQSRFVAKARVCTHAPGTKHGK